MAEEIKHRGEFMKSLVDQAGYTYTQLAELLERDRQTLGKWFKQDDLDLSRCKKIADVIKVDLRAFIPEMSAFYSMDLAEEKDSYKEKYFELLEKYSRVNEKLMILMEEKSEYSSKSKSRDGNGTK